jgi:hypothetical protein
MASVDLSLINAAAGRTGNDPISILATDSGPIAAVARTNYEDLIKAELSTTPWKRATKIASLNRIDADISGDPPEAWTAAYQIPTDMLELRTVKVSGYPIDYEVFSDKILCNAAAADDVVMHYIWRVPESDFPPWFREGIIRRLEAIFLRAVGERYREAEARDKAADDQLKLAKNRDAQSQTPRDPMVSPTLRARGAGTPIFSRFDRIVR